MLLSYVLRCVHLVAPVERERFIHLCDSCSVHPPATSLWDGDAWRAWEDGCIHVTCTATLGREAVLNHHCLECKVNITQTQMTDSG